MLLKSYFKQNDVILKLVHGQNIVLDYSITTTSAQSIKDKMACLEDYLITVGPLFLIWFSFEYKLRSNFFKNYMKYKAVNIFR